MKSNSELLSLIWELESKVEINKIQWRGTCVWPHFRPYVYNELNKHYNNVSRSFSYNLKSLIPVLKKTLLKTSFSFVKKKFFTFSCNERWRLDPISGRLCDRVSGCVSDALGDDMTQSFYIHDFRYDIEPNRDNEQSISLFFALFLVLSSFEFYFSGKIQRMTKSLDKDINNELGIRVDTKKAFRKYIAQYYLGKFITKISKIEAAFVVNASSFGGLIHAFNESGVSTIELQHGIINGHHYGYSYKHTFNCFCFPKVFISWGEYFQKLFENGILGGMTKVVDGGYFFLDRVRMQRLCAEGTRVLITGQDELETKIFDFISQVIDDSRLADVQFVYLPRRPKPVSHVVLEHPKFEYLVATDFYSEIIRCSHHLSVYSSTLLESIALQIPTGMIMIHPNANDYYLDLRTEKCIYSIENVQDLLDFIFDKNNYRCKPDIFGNMLHERIIDSVQKKIATF